MSIKVTEALSSASVRDGAEPATVMRDEIRASHRRSSRCGVRRVGAIHVPPRLGVDRPSGALRHAMDIVDEVASLFDGHDIAVVVVNARGRIAAVEVCDESRREQLAAFGVGLGADWGEEAAGTNAFGLALRERAAATVAGGEHYLAGLLAVDTVAAPVIHPLHARLVGAIGLVAFQPHDLPALQAAITLAARCVELSIRSDETADEYALLDDFLRASSRDDAAAVIALGETGMEIANPAAVGLLGRTDRALVRQQAEDATRSGDSSLIHLTIGDDRAVSATVRRSDVNGRRGLIVRIRENHVRSADQATRQRSASSAVGRAFLGRSRVTAYVREQVEQVTPGQPLVVISGEPGVGKYLLAELVAERMGASGGDRTRVLDAGCSTQLDILAQFEPAARAGGVLILRNIEHLDRATLRAMGDVTASVDDLRLVMTRNERHIAAQPRDVAPELEYFNIRIPPLRERLDDIADLAPYFVSRVRPNLRVTPALMSTLVRHDWPGNVSELEALLRAAALRAQQRDLTMLDLPASFLGGGRSLGRLEHIERITIVKALQESKGNKVLAAEALGISRATLYRKLRSYAINYQGDVLAS